MAELGGTTTDGDAGRPVGLGLAGGPSDVGSGYGEDGGDSEHLAEQLSLSVGQLSLLADRLLAKRKQENSEDIFQDSGGASNQG